MQRKPLPVDLTTVPVPLATSLTGAFSVAVPLTAPLTGGFLLSEPSVCWALQIESPVEE